MLHLEPGIWFLYNIIIETSGRNIVIVAKNICLKSLNRQLSIISYLFYNYKN